MYKREFGSELASLVRLIARFGIGEGIHVYQEPSPELMAAGVARNRYSESRGAFQRDRVRAGGKKREPDAAFHRAAMDIRFCGCGLRAARRVLGCRLFAGWENGWFSRMFLGFQWKCG